MNWFILATGVLQMMGSAYYIYLGAPKLGTLYFLYALTNVVIFSMKGE